MRTKKTLNLLTRLLSAALFCVPIAAVAAGTAIIKFEDSSTTIHWQDNGNLRLDDDQSIDEYILMVNNTPYVISREESDYMVIDMTGADELIKEFGGELDNNPHTWGRIKTLNETKESKTVAGIKGNVYKITLTTSAADQYEHIEAVLTDNPEVTKLTQTYSDFVKSTFNIDEFKSLLDQLPKDQRGILSFGRYINIESFSSDKPESSLFDLPAEPISFGDLMQEVFMQ